MIKLRKILLSNYLYYVILFTVLIISLIRTMLPNKSIYKEQSIKKEFIITKITIDEDKLTINLLNKETLIGTYYFKTKQEQIYFKNNIHLGDKIKVAGELILPKENTNKYLYNYKKYLSIKNINYLINISSYKKISSTKNIFYILKQKIINHLDNNPYLNAFILGDKSYIRTSIIKSYQENSISHLFAISGMHISLLSSIILKLLRKITSEEKSYFITSIFLIIYLFLVGLSPSILRGVLFFILFSINKIYYFYIKPINIFIITLSITLLINPLYIYDIAFQYSFLISFTLLYMSECLKGTYLISLLKVSLLSFIVSIPISLMNYFQINILSIIYNLIYVPFITIIIFPLTLIVSIFKFLLPIYDLLIYILENTSLLLSKINILKLTFYRLPSIIYIIYLLLVIFILIKIKQNNYKYLIILIILLLIHYLIPSITRSTYLNIIDVGQGDSIIVTVENETVLIDTGGKLQYKNFEFDKKIKQSTISENTLIPVFKSLGIKQLKYLIITHGDEDHMGEAINLVNNFKIDKVIFNCGEFNDLEKDLVKVLDKKKIKYYSCIKELNIKDNKMYFLNNNDYGNENDNSNVIYTELNNHKFLFMGDAGIKVEEELIRKYNLQNIDVLKVGHHGSKTSSSKNFIDEINPKYSIISVGKNNRYAHPNKEVLDNLKDSTIYRTDYDGSIMFKIKNNKLKIETCTP